MFTKTIAVSSLLALSMACISPEGRHRENVASIQAWKDNCGLLWIVNTDPMVRLNLQITSPAGVMENYGSGTLVESKHLVSSFCRTQWTPVKRFTMLLTSRDRLPISGNVEAWFNGKLLDTFTFDRTTTFHASIAIGKETP
jgi:hypothetical protein